MPEFILNVGSEVPLFLLLLALLGFRGEVRPRASVKIAAAPEAVFRLLDLQEGEMRRWQRTKVRAALIDPERQTYRLTFTTPLSTGATQSSQADFKIAERLAPHILDIERAGLEGRSLNNELLRMRAELRPEDQGTRLTLAYHWGSRPVLAQLLARADLWGSIYRLKGEAETGKPDYRTDLLITAAVALATGVVTLGTFAYAFGWIIAVLLVVALLVHELGHLLAYRLIGQPWGRLVFLPFLGGIAVPRIGFTSQAQTVFSAMMGPAFSIIVPLLALLYAWMELPYPQIAVSLGVVASLLNLFNLLPVEPLDGGVILRSLLARLMGSYARYGLIAMGLLLALAGWQLEILLLLVFGLLATVANIRPRKIDSGLTPMTRLEIAISAFAFVAVLGAYAVLLQSLMGNAAIQS